MVRQKDNLKKILNFQECGLIY